MNNFQINDFYKGLIIGILIGEGHFGGDGKQPHITIRMHTRHEKLFKLLLTLLPGSKLFGPYHHSGRDYYQFMVRGETLKNILLPLIENSNLKEINLYTFERYQKMKKDYNL